MKNKNRRLAFGLLFFLLTAGVWSQVTIVSPPQSFVVGVTVPPILKLSIDNTINNAITIAARYASPETYLIPAPGLFAFDLKPGAVFQIGTIRVFSNLIGAYAIKIESVNRGHMTAMDGRNAAVVPYTIQIGAAPLSSASGEFSFPLSGKSDHEGDEYLLSLFIGAFPENLPSGIYYDKLILSLSKE